MLSLCKIVQEGPRAPSQGWGLARYIIRSTVLIRACASKMNRNVMFRKPARKPQLQYRKRAWRHLPREAPHEERVARPTPFHGSLEPCRETEGGLHGKRSGRRPNSTAGWHVLTDSLALAALGDSQRSIAIVAPAIVYNL